MKKLYEKVHKECHGNVWDEGSCKLWSIELFLKHNCCKQQRKRNKYIEKQHFFCFSLITHSFFGLLTHSSYEL